MRINGFEYGLSSHLVGGLSLDVPAVELLSPVVHEVFASSELIKPKLERKDLPTQWRTELKHEEQDWIDVPRSDSWLVVDGLLRRGAGLSDNLVDYITDIDDNAPNVLEQLRHYTNGIEPELVLLGACRVMWKPSLLYRNVPASL